MAGLENHINETELNETGKVEAIKKVIEKVNSEVNDAYINTLSGLDKTKVSEAIKNLIQNSDGSYKTNKQINRKDSGYQFLVQVALQLLYLNETNLLGDRKIDAEYGQATRNAVAKFQGENGIQVDGDAGIQTLRAMKEILAGNTISDEVKNIYTTPQANIRDAEVVANRNASNKIYTTVAGTRNIRIEDSEPTVILKAVQNEDNLYTREGRTGKYARGSDGKIYYVTSDITRTPISIFDGKKWEDQTSMDINKLPKEVQPIYTQYLTNKTAETTAKAEADKKNIFNKNNENYKDAVAKITADKFNTIVPVCQLNGIIVFSAIENSNKCTYRIKYDTKTKEISYTTLLQGNRDEENIRNMAESISDEMSIPAANVKELYNTPYTKFKTLRDGYNAYWTARKQDGTLHNEHDNTRKDTVLKTYWKELPDIIGSSDARDVLEWLNSNKNTGDRFIKWGAAVTAKGGKPTLRDFIIFEQFRPSKTPWNTVI